MTDDRAPRWLVRWIATGALLVLIAGIGMVIYAEITMPARIEATLLRANCEYAWNVIGSGNSLIECHQ